MSCPVLSEAKELQSSVSIKGVLRGVYPLFGSVAAQNDNYSSELDIKGAKNLSVGEATALTEKMAAIFSEIEDPRVEKSN